MGMLPYLAALLFWALAPYFLQKALPKLYSPNTKAALRNSEDPWQTLRALGFAVALVASWGLFSLFILARSAWGFVRVPQFADITFYDLRFVTRAAECFAQVGLLDGLETCANNYPVVWGISLGVLGVRESSTDALGYFLWLSLLITLSLIAYTVFLRKLSCLTVSVLALAFYSPPVFLVLYVGNIEAFVFCLTSFSVLLLATTSNKIWSVIALVGLMLATYLKPSAIGASVGVLGRKSFVRWRVPLFVVSLAAPLVLLSWELPRIYPLAGGVGAAPQSWHISFGSSILPARLLSAAGISVTESIWIVSPLPRVIGLAVFCALIFFFYLLIRVLSKRNMSHAGQTILTYCNRLKSSQFCFVVFLAGSGAYVVAFATGTNFDYRLIFLILVLASQVLLVKRRDYVAVALTLLGIMTLYLSFVPFPILGRLTFSYYEVPGEVFSFILAVCLGGLSVFLLRSDYAQFSLGRTGHTGK